MAAPPIPVAALRDPVVLLATGLGSGLLRPAPGTWGTVAGLIGAWALSLLPLPVAIAVICVAGLLGIPLCTLAGRRLGVKDHGGIVWDEWVGVWLTLVCFPFELLTVAIGFALFRFFDIVKPWPVSWADRELDDGLGVMLDDLIAGVYAAGVLFALRALLPL